MSKRMISLLQVASLFPGVAVLRLPLEGSVAAGIQPFHLALLMASLFALGNPTFRVRLKTLLMVLSLLSIAIFGILLSPGELPNQLVGTTGLSPWGQLLYWVTAMATFLLFQGYAHYSKNAVSKDWYPFILGGLLVSLIGFYQIIAYHLNLPYPANWFNNNPSFLQRYADTIWGIKRLTASFPEASMYGLYATGALFISLTFRGKWWTIVRLAILVSAILTFSTTAFLGLALFIAWVVIVVSQKPKHWTNKVTFLFFALLFAFTLFWLMYKILLDKVSSESGIERYLSFISGIALWLQSPWIGWGLGSGRTTDGLSNLLLNFGLIGGALLVLLIAQGVFPITPRSDLVHLQGGLLALFLLHLISNPDWTFPYIWMLLGYITGKSKLSFRGNTKLKAQP